MLISVTIFMDVGEHDLVAFISIGKSPVPFVV